MAENITRMETEGNFSRAVICNGMVFLSGLATAAEDKDSCKTMTDHAESTFRRIDHYLAMAGTDKRHILSATVYILNDSQKAEFNAAWQKWIPAGCQPARTALACCGCTSEWPLEITIVAALPE